VRKIDPGLLHACNRVACTVKEKETIIGDNRQTGVLVPGVCHCRGGAQED
jgi:hypothetical protein